MVKILYAGSPEASAKTLQILIQSQKDCDFQIAGVLTNPPSAKGRHKELIPTPVAQVAQENNIPVFCPEHLDSAARDSISPLGAQLLVTFAYGHIFGPKFLSFFQFGGINLHPSLLPKYRGCTPVPAAILNRDEMTAATVQTLALKMDEGDILAQTFIPLDGTQTAESLLNNAAEEGAELFCTVITMINDEGQMPKGQPQEGQASYTSIITKEDGKIDWNQAASAIEAKIRAYYPEPGSWCMDKDQSLRILEATFIPEDSEKAAAYSGETCGKVLQFVKSEGIYIKTGNGILVARQLQRQGKKAMNYKDFMNGARDFLGTVLQ